MKLSEILRGVEIITRHVDLETEITNICYDSRKAVRGGLFAAVRGLDADGHDFIEAVVKSGVACVVSERPLANEIPHVVVENSRHAIALIAANYFGNPADKLKLIGVTGTNGKTTTTYLVKQMLEALTGKPVGLIGSIQNMVGATAYHTDFTTPQAIELHEMFAKIVDGGCQYAVMEVSSHSLVMDRVAGLEFEVGVFTNLTQDHLDFHNTLDEYAEAKTQLFKQSKKAAVNADDAYAASMTADAGCDVLTFSAQSDNADLVAKMIKLHPSKVEFCALMINVLERTELAIPGLFSVYNALSALAVMYQLGFSLPDAAVALTKCTGVKGRAEVVPTGRDFTVIIDYACTPDALENAITTFKECADGRVVTLFGCGGDRDRTKRPLMGEAVVRLSDYAVITSDNPRTEEPSAIINDILAGVTEYTDKYTVIENRIDAIKWAIKNSQPGDTLVLEGKGHETYQIIGCEKTHLDEREIVAEALAEL